MMNCIIYYIAVFPLQIQFSLTDVMLTGLRLSPSNTNKYITGTLNKGANGGKRVVFLGWNMGKGKVKGVEGVFPISLPGVRKLLHNINTHIYCVPKTQIIWLSNLLILSYLMNVIPETFMCTKFDIYVFITSLAM